MAETGSTGDSTLSTSGISAGPAGVAVPTPARLPGHFVPTPVTPGVAIGLPIVEVPALVEPIGFDDPPAEIRPPEPTRRPGLERQVRVQSDAAVLYLDKLRARG